MCFLSVHHLQAVVSAFLTVVFQGYRRTYVPIICYCFKDSFGVTVDSKEWRARWRCLYVAASLGLLHIIINLLFSVDTGMTSLCCSVVELVVFWTAENWKLKDLVAVVAIFVWYFPTVNAVFASFLLFMDGMISIFIFSSVALSCFPSLILDWLHYLVNG